MLITGTHQREVRSKENPQNRLLKTPLRMLPLVAESYIAKQLFCGGRGLHK
jgi:hypothetical protein